MRHRVSAVAVVIVAVRMVKEAAYVFAQGVSDDDP